MTVQCTKRSSSMGKELLSIFEPMSPYAVTFDIFRFKGILISAQLKLEFSPEIPLEPEWHLIGCFSSEWPLIGCFV